MRPSVYAGPVVAFETKCEVEGEGDGLTATADCDAISDFGIAFGGGLAIPAGPVVLVGDVRYTLGRTNIDDTAEAEEVVKNRAWSFTVGVGMPIGS